MYFLPLPPPPAALGTIAAAQTRTRSSTVSNEEKRKNVMDAFTFMQAPVPFATTPHSLPASYSSRSILPVRGMKPSSSKASPWLDTESATSAFGSSQASTASLIKHPTVPSTTRTSTVSSNEKPHTTSPSNPPAEQTKERPSTTPPRSDTKPFSPFLRHLPFLLLRLALATTALGLAASLLTTQTPNTTPPVALIVTISSTSLSILSLLAYTAFLLTPTATSRTPRHRIFFIALDVLSAALILVSGVLFSTDLNGTQNCAQDHARRYAAASPLVAGGTGTPYSRDPAWYAGRCRVAQGAEAVLFCGVAAFAIAAGVGVAALVEAKRGPLRERLTDAEASQAVQQGTHFWWIM